MKNGVNQPYLNLQQTPDGSYTFYDCNYHNHLHSINGALTESQYVYIKQGLSRIQKETICIFEMGFGTGLNAYLAYQYAELFHKTIHYHSIDIHPIPLTLLPPPDFLNGNYAAVQVWNNIIESAWNKENRISDFFNIKKQKQSIIDYQITENIDIVFYDAFAPSVQPEVWTSTIFSNLYDVLYPGGMIVTYSAARAAKTAISAAGFSMDKLPGPPGKRHMLRAVKPL
jgi:tRNA U34 5-methylaminomethyl-2-thiouridine-forming methyltransferase MnmC